MDSSLRRAVISRAAQRCEYCGIAQRDLPTVSFHVEHITARQHGGSESLDNLALACQRCNSRKGTNLTGIDPVTRAVTALFHPRRDHWSDHFEINEGLIVGLTPVGRTTVALLGMNSPDRVFLRRYLTADED